MHSYEEGFEDALRPDLKLHNGSLLNESTDMQLVTRSELGQALDTQCDRFADIMSCNIGQLAEIIQKGSPPIPGTSKPHRVPLSHSVRDAL